MDHLNWIELDRVLLAASREPVSDARWTVFCSKGHGNLCLEEHQPEFASKGIDRTNNRPGSYTCICSHRSASTAGSANDMHGGWLATPNS
jgi:hypothetical protein